MAIWQHTGPAGDGGTARFAFSHRWGGGSQAPYPAAHLGRARRRDPHG